MGHVRFIWEGEAQSLVETWQYDFMGELVEWEALFDSMRIKGAELKKKIPIFNSFDKPALGKSVL